jgi:O-acetyl-ADP-ribose deacetylase (regulator of RNase III)
MKSKIKIIKGDITKVRTEAIVNAANTTLLGGGGVDGKIHRAAGPKLFEECKKLGGCETGEAKITKGYNLLAKYVIHTVGPIWQGGNRDEEEKLASCYRNSLELAAKYKIKSIAFPSISTGAYGFPIEKAAPIALKEVRKFLEENDAVKEVIFVLFSEKDFQIYQNLGPPSPRIRPSADEVGG